MMPATDNLNVSSASSENISAIATATECFITSLPTEVIREILDFVPYEAHLNLALTCKTLAGCADKILKRHQDAFAKYRVASDVDPESMPTLLRSMFGRTDPLIAWHVRSMEIWYDRKSWGEWKTLQFDQPLGDGDMVDATWKWQEDQIEDFLADIEDQLVALMQSGDDEIFTQAREEFESGHDGIVKALLIAYCPRLRDVTFVAYEHNEGTTLRWLRKLIQGSILHGGSWPPGLCSVENVAVGVDSDTWMTTRHTFPMEGSDRSMETFSSLLRLPRLSSIYYSDIRRPGWDDPQDYASPTLMPPRCSAVKHIYLENPGHMDYSFRNALTSAPRALETFTLRAGDSGDRLDDADAIVSGLTSEQDSLHTLMLYGPYTNDQIHGYRCSIYRNEELQSAGRLKTVAMDIADVDLDCMYNMDGNCGDWSEEKCKEFFCKWMAETAFPESVERIVFFGHPNGCYMPKCGEKFLDWLEEAFIKIIQSWDWPECEEEEEEEEEEKDGSDAEALPDAHEVSTAEEVHDADELPDADDDVHGESSDAQSGNGSEKDDASESGNSDAASDESALWNCLSNLKAIYLADIEREWLSTPETRGPNYTQIQHPTTKVYFQKLMEIAKANEVDVHTLTNREPPMYTHDFPTAPEKYDLRSGPWWTRRDEVADWVFDVYKGRRVPPKSINEGQKLYGEIWKKSE